MHGRSALTQALRRFGPYYVEPLIAGLEEDGTPFIASTDLIGCPLVTTDFVVGGTCSEQLYGMCEALHNPDMGPDELFEAISQALLNAQDRDALSGWGGVVHIMYVPLLRLCLSTQCIG